VKSIRGALFVQPVIFQGYIISFNSPFFIVFWFFVTFGGSKLSQMLIQSRFYMLFDKPFIDSDKKPAKCHK